MMENKKIGLLTYHSAYNFGSALQALATQNVIKSMAGDCTIINYRMKSQKRFYANIRTNLGAKTFIKDILRAPADKQLSERARRFENLQKKYFNLTEEYETPEEIYKSWNEFDTIVSGSDQIWNKHSCELENNDWLFMHPYLLKDYRGKKVSYASSVGNMEDQELEQIKPFLTDFTHIAMREPSSAEKISKLLNRDIPSVVDPTLLFTGTEWKKMLGVTDKRTEPYILYYSLFSYKEIKKWIPVVESFAADHHMKARIITPFVYMKIDKDISERHYEYGPVDFIDAINNATFIVTDSYHGTLFSLNLHKKFASYCQPGGSEFRKTDILNTVGLEDHIIWGPEGLDKYYEQKTDFDSVDEKLELMRDKSKQYLVDALNS